MTIKTLQPKNIQETRPISANEMEFVELPTALGQACADFLVTQPYNQVATLIDSLKKLKPIEGSSNVLAPLSLLINLDNYMSKIPIVQLVYQVQHLINKQK